MIVLRLDHRVYYPKLDIRACLTIDKLYGDVTKPLMSHMSTDTQVLLLSLSLQRYNLSDDELYDLTDSVEDLYSLILELYKEGGLINQGEQQDTVEDDSASLSDVPSEVITFESHMMDLLEQCMSIGMTEDNFYNSTLSQVTRYVNAYNKQQENELQEKAYFDYQLANLIGMSVSRLLSKDAKYPKFEEAYPFTKVGEGKAKEVDEEWQMEVQRNILMQWAEQINKKQSKGDEVE